jgi:glutamate/aspartate transport system substrate-binding protein
MQKLMTCLLLALWISGFPQASHAREPVLGKVLETGRITFGYAEDRLPFSFNDQNGNPAGYSIDLCRAIAEQVRKELKLPKLDIEFIKVESSERVNALVHSRVDMDCGTATQTLTRMERVDFTFMTFVTGASMVSRRDTGSAEPSQIQGKRVAVISGTTTEEVLAQYLIEAKLTAEVIPVGNFAGGMGLLEEGEVDGFFSDRVLLMGQIMKSPIRDKLQLSEDLISYEPYALMLPRDDGDFRLIANRALANIYSGNQIGVLYKKWFGLIDPRPSTLLISLFRLQALPE